jgi:hypothetical protein
MAINTLRAVSWGGAIVAFIPHLFTCVLPAVAGLLGATGVLGAGWVNTPWGHAIAQYHMVLLIVATFASIISALSAFGQGCACGDACTCTSQRNCGCVSSRASKIFSVALVGLVVASWVVFLVPGHVHHTGHMMPEGATPMPPEAAFEQWFEEDEPAPTDTSAQPGMPEPSMPEPGMDMPPEHHM